MIDFARRRLTMVDTQLRPNEVTDTRLIAAMRRAATRALRAGAFRAFAYIDEGIEVFPAIDAAPARFSSRRWSWRGSSSSPLSNPATRSSMSAAPRLFRRNPRAAWAGGDGR